MEMWLQQDFRSLAPISQRQESEVLLDLEKGTLKLHYPPRRHRPAMSLDKAPDVAFGECLQSGGQNLSSVFSSLRWE